MAESEEQHLRTKVSNRRGAPWACGFSDMPEGSGQAPNDV